MRVLLALCVAFALGGCAHDPIFESAQAAPYSSNPFFSDSLPPNYVPAEPQEPAPDADYDTREYSATATEVPLSQVPYASNEAPGTIVVDSADHFLYLIQDGGTARRYGIGVGRRGFKWHDTVAVGRKQAWPDWHPPKEMIARELRKNPDWLRNFQQDSRGGWYMVGAPGNPLGMRALYLFRGKQDTEYRIHGTYEPWTIGSDVSSGCIRLRNVDILDLYKRVDIGAKVIVR